MNEKIKQLIGEFEDGYLDINDFMHELKMLIL